MSTSNIQGAQLRAVFPLEIQWLYEADFAYKRFTTGQLKDYLNFYFEERKKNIRIVEVAYVQETPLKQDQPQLVGSTGSKENVVPAQGNAISQIEMKQYLDRQERLQTLERNIGAVIQLNIYGTCPRVTLSSNKALASFPQHASIQALAQMAPHEYNSLDNFNIIVKSARNTLLLRHPKVHKQHRKVEVSKDAILNWSYSCRLSPYTISHYIDFTQVLAKSKQINQRIEMAACILHSSSSEFEVVSEIFNGVALKFSIENKNVKMCGLYESESQDVFYFHLCTQPPVSGLVKDRSVARSIQYEEPGSWEKLPPLFYNKFFAFQNPKPYYGEYFEYSQLMILEVSKAQPASYYLRSFCYSAKDRFQLLQQPLESIPLLSLITRIRQNCYELMMYNMFIQDEVKINFTCIIKKLLFDGQLSMMDVLEIFSMDELVADVEVFSNILEIMMEGGGVQGAAWVKAMYFEYIRQQRALQSSTRVTELEDVVKAVDVQQNLVGSDI